MQRHGQPTPLDLQRSRTLPHEGLSNLSDDLSGLRLQTNMGEIIRPGYSTALNPMLSPSFAQIASFSASPLIGPQSSDIASAYPYMNGFPVNGPTSEHLQGVHKPILMEDPGRTQRVPPDDMNLNTLLASVPEARTPTPSPTKSRRDAPSNSDPNWVLPHLRRGPYSANGDPEKKVVTSEVKPIEHKPEAGGTSSGSRVDAKTGPDNDNKSKPVNGSWTQAPKKKKKTGRRKGSNAPSLQTEKPEATQAPPVVAEKKGG